MSKLSAIHKQIAALQAQAERITKDEMSGAIAKVKGLMSEFGLTIEHLTQSVVGKVAGKKPKATKAAKAVRTKTASVAKYADPKTGKTWSGMGRAPAWIAAEKNRDDFLVGASKSEAKPVATKKATTTAAAPAKKSSKAKVASTAKPAAKKAAAPKAAAKKKPATKAPASKKAVKAKAVAKKTAPATANAPTDGAATAA